MQKSFPFWLVFMLAGCFSDSDDGASGNSSSAESEDGDGDAGTGTPADDGSSGVGSSNKTGESSNGDQSDGGTGTTEGASTLTDSNTTANDSNSTGSSETADGIPLDGICDPLDPNNLCAQGLACSIWKWDIYDNLYRFHCIEYYGDENGGMYGDPISAGDLWNKCQTGFAPLNNFNGANYPDGVCVSMGTCCTAICSSIALNCPSGTSCNLFIEPIDMNFYTAQQYGQCQK